MRKAPGQVLAKHPAHRHANVIHPRNAQRIEEGNHVVAQIIESIGAR